jgi:hypothetical protein
VASKNKASSSQPSWSELLTLGLKELRRAKLIEANGLSEIIDAAARIEHTNSSVVLRSIDSLEGNTCYLSLRQLTIRIPYSEKTLRNLMSTGELIQGNHFFKRRGRIMFSWPAMREWVEGQKSSVIDPIPLVRNRKNGYSK